MVVNMYVRCGYMYITGGVCMHIHRMYVSTYIYIYKNSSCMYSLQLYIYIYKYVVAVHMNVQPHYVNLYTLWLHSYVQPQHYTLWLYI